MTADKPPDIMSEFQFYLTAAIPICSSIVRTSANEDTLCPGGSIVLARFVRPHVPSHNESTKAKRLDPGDKLATLLQIDGEPDADSFWRDVSMNLAARRLRLLFVADDIPDPLERVVEFLNGHMSGIEVLAVEIKQFRSKSTQTLVPRVIGRTAGSSASGTAGHALRLRVSCSWTGFASADEARCVADRLLNATRKSGCTLA